jgi:uncharacterized protein YjbI with pentapeptide repeats
VRAKVTGANLAGALLRKADLRKADLRDANLSGADLQGVDGGQADFGKGNLAAANVSNSTLVGARFGSANLGSAVLKGCDLGDADFTDANLHEADLHKTNLVGAVFVGADLSGADLQKASLRDGKGPPIPGEKRAHLRGARLHRVDFRGSDLAGHDLEDADLRDCRLDGVNLVGATLKGADLGGAQMEEADVRGCDFVGVRFDSLTMLRRAKVKDVRIDRHTLESLKDYGGLTPGDRMQMKILDGVTLLRSHYAGFWQWIHLFALVLFVFPYGWFVFSQYAIAESGVRDRWEDLRLSAGKAEEAARKSPIIGRGLKADDPVLGKIVPKERVEVPIWTAILRFIWNGGRDWETGYHLDPVSFGIFVFSFLYNLTRFIMVFKTAELELHQEASGLPVPVSALGVWGRLVHIMEVGFCINVVLVLIHTFHFLQKPIVMYIEKG